MTGVQTCALPISGTLIASDVESYLDIAQRLLADSEKRGHLRDEISSHADALFNDSKPVMHMREWLLQHVTITE